MHYNMGKQNFTILLSCFTSGDHWYPENCVAQILRLGWNEPAGVVGYSDTCHQASIHVSKEEEEREHFNKNKGHICN